MEVDGRWSLSGDSVEVASLGTKRKESPAERLTNRNLPTGCLRQGGRRRLRARSLDARIGDHGTTLPDWVVVMVTGACDAAGTVTTTVTGVGADAEMTVAPGGAVWPAAS